MEKSKVVNEVKMRWEETGQGPAVVFVHGIPTSPGLWRHVIPKVSNARCLAWEMVGYGGSMEAGHDRDISVARQADYLTEWIRDQGLEKVVLVGHDLGGGVCQILAAHNPELVAGIVLINAICYDSWPIPSVKMMRATGGIMKHLPDGMFEPVMRSFLERGHETHDQASEAFDVHWPYYKHGDGAAEFVRQTRSLNVNDTLGIADELPKLDKPSRVVWGVADQFQKIEYGERLARDLNAPLHRIEGGKHFVPEDHPQEIADAVNSVLDEAGLRPAQP